MPLITVAIWCLSRRRVIRWIRIRGRHCFWKELEDMQLRCSSWMWVYNYVVRPELEGHGSDHDWEDRKGMRSGYTGSNGGEFRYQDVLRTKGREVREGLVPFPWAALVVSGRRRLVFMNGPKEWKDLESLSFGYLAWLGPCVVKDFFYLHAFRMYNI